MCGRNWRLIDYMGLCCQWCQAVQRRSKKFLFGAKWDKLCFARHEFSQQQHIPFRHELLVVENYLTRILYRNLQPPPCRDILLLERRHGLPVFEQVYIEKLSLFVKTKHTSLVTKRLESYLEFEIIINFHVLHSQVQNYPKPTCRLVARLSGNNQISQRSNRVAIFPNKTTLLPSSPPLPITQFFLSIPSFFLEDLSSAHMPINHLKN